MLPVRLPFVTIIDDDESVRESTKSLVRSLGYGAIAFASAEEFLTSKYVVGTSCLVTDVQMPGMSGIELQMRLKETGHRAPVIFITAFPEQGVRRRAVRAGALGFLSKPFQDDDLVACLETALNAGRSPPATRN